MGLEGAASEALRLATIEPVAARELGSDALAAARSAGDWLAASIADRALGVASLQLNELDAAIAYLREAVRYGRRAGSAHRVGEARMSLASALLLRGRPARAFREIEAALGELSGVSAARARTQRAAILQEIGRVDEALEDLRRALPVLRRAGDIQWASRALSNRGLLYVRKRAFTDAKADFLAARQLCDQHGLGWGRVYVDQNLGYLNAQRGDVPAALYYYGLAEEGYRRFGLEAGTLLVDRAKLLLSVRLVREARDAAEAAVTAFQRQKRQTHLPEAELVLSTAALVEGDTATALQAAERAVRKLYRLGRREWLPLARYARLQALVADGGRSVAPGEARRVADSLQLAGWVVPALEARVLAGQLALQHGQRRQARADLERAGRARRSGPAEVRARAWLAEALLRRADGDRGRARSAVRAGLRVVEEYRATLGATELRAHVSVHRGELAQLGLRMALEDGRARSVLSWAERARANALLLRPAQPPDDAVLARDLSELRATVTDINRRTDSGRAVGSLIQRQIQLERAIRDRSRRAPGGITTAAAAGHGSLDQLGTRLADAALVEYVEIDRHLHAVTLVASRARLHPLGSVEAVRREMDHLPFALLRLANPRTRQPSRSAATAVLRRASAVFDEVLFRPLRRAINGRPLVIVPSATLQSLPWSIVPSCMDRPVVVSPSAMLWQAAAGRAVLAPPHRIVVVAGPGLAGAVAEATAVAELYPGSLLLVGDSASADQVSTAMEGAALVHLAAHGVLRADNPLFSSLVMADGPFTIYDLERLRSAPRLVVLAACDTARSHPLAGGEILGFTAALLAGGTTTLVAPLMPVPDAQTAPLMRVMHGHLRAGRSAAEALSVAMGEVREDDPLAAAGTASFVCLGSGLAPAASAGYTGREAAVPAQATGASSR